MKATIQEPATVKTISVNEPKNWILVITAETNINKPKQPNMKMDIFLWLKMPIDNATKLKATTP